MYCKVIVIWNLYSWKEIQIQGTFSVSSEEKEDLPLIAFKLPFGWIFQGVDRGGQPALRDMEATGKFTSFVSKITQCFLHKWDYHLQFKPSCDWAFLVSSESNYGSESNSAFRINPSVMASKSGFSWLAMHSNISVPYSSRTVSFTQLLSTQE